MVSGSTHTFSCVSAYTCAYAHACVVRVNQPLHGRKIPHKIPMLSVQVLAASLLLGRRQGEGRIVLFWLMNYSESRFVWLRIITRTNRFQKFTFSVSSTCSHENDLALRV